MHSFSKPNKNINMSSFKSSENIQKKEGGPDISVSDNQIHLFMEYAQFFHLMLLSLSELTFMVCCN